jgi:hypothetical protein
MPTLVLERQCVGRIGAPRWEGERMGEQQASNNRVWELGMDKFGYDTWGPLRWKVQSKEYVGSLHRIIKYSIL